MSDLLFIPINWINILDIFLVALLLFQLHKLIRGTVAINIFFGIIIIYLIWKMLEYFQMKILSEILGQFISMGFIIIIVVFQQELRKFLLMVGSPKFTKKSTINKILQRFQMSKSTFTLTDPVAMACREFSYSKTGALIVITKTNDLEPYMETGDQIDANVSKQLIENIFFKNSPMHDGAIIIAGNKIKAARCILPLSDRFDLPPSYGLRHRAGIGVTEHSDAVAIIVSEQTGSISICTHGQIRYDISYSILKQRLQEEFNG